MDKILGKYSPQIYALMRIAVGFMFACHGAQKLFGWFGGDPKPLLSLLGIGGVIEFFGGLMILLGFFASWAAFLASGTMAVGYFMFHFSVEKFWPIQNQGELAAVYAFLFLYIAARGSGIWSLEGAFKK
jgi:putative oxidoreductase